MDVGANLTFDFKPPLLGLHATDVTIISGTFECLRCGSCTKAGSPSEIKDPMTTELPFIFGTDESRDT